MVTNPAPETSPPIGVRLTPVAASARAPALDVLRGFALFGILVVNLQLFAAPMVYMLAPSDFWPERIDQWALLLIALFGEGKFYALFALLFGVGFSLQLERARSLGADFAVPYIRRLVVLLLLGLTHATLLWFGDILALYAVLGFGLLWVAQWRRRTVWTVAGLVYLAPLAFFTALAMFIPADLWQGNEEGAYLQALAVEGAAAQDAYRSGGFTELLQQRLRDYSYALLGLIVMAPVVMALFLLGALLGRTSLFYRPERHRPLWLTLAVVALPAGLVFNAFFAVLIADRGLLFGWRLAEVMLLQSLGVPLLTGGYVGVLMLLVATEWGRARLAPIAAAGRMALTNYLMQTAICTTLFYGWGFGWYGYVRPVLWIPLAAVIFVLQLAWSVLWLRYFQLGPLEWGWRTWTYLRWQPLRRSVVPHANGNHRGL